MSIAPPTALKVSRKALTRDLDVLLKRFGQGHNSLTEGRLNLVAMPGGSIMTAPGGTHVSYLPIFVLPFQDEVRMLVVHRSDGGMVAFGLDNSLSVENKESSSCFVLHPARFVKEFLADESDDNFEESYALIMSVIDALEVALSSDVDE